MIFLSILIFIVALSLPSKKLLTPTFFLRISSIIFIYGALLSFNSLYIESIGSGIGIYSGLFLISSFSQSFDILILITASLIFIAWPIINISTSFGNLGKNTLKNDNNSININLNLK